MTWLQRQVGGGRLTQKLEPWHLRGEVAMPPTMWRTLVGACGVSLPDIVAETVHPPDDVLSLCGVCDAVWRSREL
jgi:hypothetical protein